MIALVDSWQGWMTAMSVQLVPLIVIVALIDRLVGRRLGASGRMLLWYTPMLKLLVPPTVSSPFSLAQVTFGDSAATLSAGLLPATASWWPFALWAIGLAGSAFLGIRRSRALHRRLLGASRAAPDWVCAEAIRAAERLGLRRVPRVYLVNEPIGPAVAGTFRPFVILPAAFCDEASRARIHHALLHEFAHIQRCDPVASMICRGLHMVYWFHPLVWLTRAQLSTLREIRCDETVVRALEHESGAYRTTLLWFARRLLAEPAPVGALGLITPHSQLLARLNALLHPDAGGGRGRRALTTLMIAAVSVCALPLGRSPRNDFGAGGLPAATSAGCLQLRYTVMRAMADFDSQRELLADGS
jgi:beta-lactamase regulating signal transducer with metallopeptidase domain